MTSATPAPAACGAQLTTIQVDPNTSARLYTMLNSQATPMLTWPTRYLRHLPNHGQACYSLLSMWMRLSHAYPQKDAAMHMESDR